MSEKTPVKRLPRKEIQPLNEEAMKGVFVDGIGFHVSEHSVILEGVIGKPRADKNYVVSRLIFPIKMLDSMIDGLTKVREQMKKKYEESKKAKSSGE